MSVEFAGSSNALINCGSDPSIDNIVRKTVTAWIRAITIGENLSGRIVDKDNESAGRLGWFFMTGDVTANITYAHGWSTAPFGFAMWRGDNGTLPLEVWTHVAVTYDSSSVANDPVLYVNGVAIGLTEFRSPSGVEGDDSAQTLTIGNRTGTQNVEFDGQIDEVRVFDRILSLAEIVTLAGGYRGRMGGEVLWLSGRDFIGLSAPDQVVLVAANVLSDLSGNGNHGVPADSPRAYASDAPRIGVAAGY